MIQGKYLSGAIDIEQIIPNAANIISTPCGSGKTYFALNTLPKRFSRNLFHTVYLIDTVAGKEQLLKYKDTCSYDDDLPDIISENFFTTREAAITIMTYHKFGALAKKNTWFTSGIDLLICDEAHQLKDFIAMGRNEIRKAHPTKTPKEIEALFLKENYAYYALQEIVGICAGVERERYVVVLSATPDDFLEIFTGKVNHIKISELLRQFETFETKPYRNILQPLNSLTKGSQAICYIMHIRDIKKHEQYAIERGLTTSAIWSLHSTDHPMTEEQLTVRRCILENQRIPPEIDLLFINASYETSINIYGKVNTMIVHSQEEDTRVQARGRLREDLPLLYLYDASSHTVEVPPEFLDRRLHVKDKDELVKILNIRDHQRNPVGWTIAKRRIEESGYSVHHKKIKNLHTDTIIKAVSY